VRVAGAAEAAAAPPPPPLQPPAVSELVTNFYPADNNIMFQLLGQEGFTILPVHVVNLDPVSSILWQY
jgi:hypothetical protein